jgi:membrane-associated phospholipid phosphatase
MFTFLEGLDHRLFFAVNNGLSTLGLDYLFWMVSVLSSGAGMLIGTAIGLWCFDRRNFKSHFVWIVLALLAGGAIIQVVKYGIGRPRPLSEFALLLQKGEVHINVIGQALRSRSFPSGHAQAAASVCTYLWLLYPRWWSLWTSGLLVAAVSRVYVGVHFPSDVFAGVLLGSLATAAVMQGRQAWMAAQGDQLGET